VAALEQSETLCVRWEELRRLAAQRPALREVLVRLLAQQVRRLSELLVEAYTVDADVRVARRLLELSEEYGTVVPLTQEQLAGLAGTSRATVNRVLRHLERAGVLSLGRGRTAVVDREALARAAGRR
jgi:CRP-like cAMP-binding protein